MIGFEFTIELERQYIEVAADNGDWPAQLVGGERNKVKVVVLWLVDFGLVVGGNDGVCSIALFKIDGDIENAASFLPDDLVGNSQPNFAGANIVGALLVEPFNQVGAVVK